MGATEPRYCPISTLHRKLRQGTGSKGRARATVTRRLRTIAGFYKYTVEEELLEHSRRGLRGRRCRHRASRSGTRPPDSHHYPLGRQGRHHPARAAHRRDRPPASDRRAGVPGCGRAAARPARHSHRRRLRRRRRLGRTRSSSLRELGEDLAQVVLDPARADEQPGPRSPGSRGRRGPAAQCGPPGRSARRWSRRWHATISPVASRSRLARSPNACTPIRVQHVASGGQLLPRVSTQALVAQPLAVEQVDAGELGSNAGAFECAIEALGFAALAEQDLLPRVQCLEAAVAGRSLDGRALKTAAVAHINRKQT